MLRRMSGTIRRVAVPASLFLVAALLGGGCDLSTKAWAEETLRDQPGQTMSVIDPHVDFTLHYNEGTAFSAVQDLGGSVRVAFGVVSLLVVVVLFVVAVRKPEHRIQALALGTIAGGAIGNGLDRILRTGVVDFIQVNYPWGGSWPVFNVADALVAVGVAVLLIGSWVSREPPPSPAEG